MMPRKLKTYQTSIGFYDLANAAPSMKRALEVWGAGSNLFHQGFSKETDDPEVVAATMSKPGVVLKRATGSNGRFAEHAGVPTDLGDKGRRERKKRRRPDPCIPEQATHWPASCFDRCSWRDDPPEMDDRGVADFDGLAGC
jgi:hypothetical protein